MTDWSHPLLNSADLHTLFTYIELTVLVLENQTLAPRMKTAKSLDVSLTFATSISRSVKLFSELALARDIMHAEKKFPRAKVS